MQKKKKKKVGENKLVAINENYIPEREGEARPTALRFDCWSL